MSAVIKSNTVGEDDDCPTCGSSFVTILGDSLICPRCAAAELAALRKQLEETETVRNAWCKCAVAMIQELRNDYAPGDLGELDGVKAIVALRTRAEKAEARVKGLEDRLDDAAEIIAGEDI